MDLLHAMGQHLGYRFDKVHLKRAAYFPRGYGEQEFEQVAIRKALAGLLTGEASLPIEIRHSADPEQAKEQEELGHRMRRFFGGEVSLKITRAGPHDGDPKP